MVTNSQVLACRWWTVVLFVGILVGCLTGCGTGVLNGMVYTNVKLPLTEDLNATPVPDTPPGSNCIVEAKEPISGAGMYARMSVNAIGDIAIQNGVKTLYFADQEIFSILGIWKTHRVYLYIGTIPTG